MSNKLTQATKTVAASVAAVLGNADAKARRDLVEALWQADPRAAAEAYRRLNEIDPKPLIELAAAIVEAVPVLRRFEEAGRNGREDSEAMKNRLSAVQQNPPREIEQIDKWIGTCQRLETEAYQLFLRGTWSEAAGTYLAAMGNRFPELAKDPRWHKADKGPVDFPTWEQAQRAYERTTSQAYPTRLVDGVLRSVQLAAAPRKKLLIRATMRT
jgi:hypothetical protein